MRTVRLRVTLREVRPRVVRVIDVPAVTVLPELHELLQSALGWTDSHLHEFVVGETRYGVPDVDDEMGELDESMVRLADLPDQFTYWYDFGDDWMHDVERLGPGGKHPGCVDGEGSCPPEDCGGPHGYAELLAALADPRHPEHEQLRSWTGNRLVTFDRSAVDDLVRRTVGEVPASVRLVIGLAADGVTLTPGGRLPRTFVRAVQEQRPAWSPLGRPAAVEEDLLPLAAAHDLLRHVGLLRLRNGVLSATKAAADDLNVVRRLRSWFHANELTTQVATSTVALLSALGPQPFDALAEAVFPLLSYGWSVNGRPVTVTDVRTTITRLGSVLRALDQVDIDRSIWRAGPGALSLWTRVSRLLPFLTEADPIAS